LIHIFGDPTNSIWDNKIKPWLSKVGLTIAVCGATSNVLTLSTPVYTEILLNVGMSLTFFWLSWWQFEQFKYKIEEFKKTSKTTKPKTKKPKSTTRVKAPRKDRKVRGIFS
jgi:hypothetical protein